MKTPLLGWALCILMLPFACTGDDKSSTPSVQKKPLPGRQVMDKDVISAEIEPAQGRNKQAALALQRLGFRILHIGPTISTQGPETLWKSTFGVSFETRKKTVLAGVKGGEVTYRKPTSDRVKIPSELEKLITAVTFTEPPEFH